MLGRILSYGLPSLRAEQCGTALRPHSPLAFVMVRETGCAAGNGERQGRLSAEDAKVMKRYQTELTIFNNSVEVDRILSWLRSTFEGP